MNTKKISNIVFFSLLAITIIIMLMFYFGGHADVAKEVPNNAGLAVNWSVVLFFVALIVTLGFFIFRIISDPKGSIKSIFGIILLVIVFLIARSLGSGELLHLPEYTGPDNVRSKIKLADMMLYTGYILFVGVFVAIIVGWILQKLRGYNRKMNKRKVPEINASTMADIAFLLLSFFLVSTTFDVDKGIFRKLPAIQEQEEDIKIKERNLFVVLVNKNDQLLVEGDIIKIGQLKDRTIEFIKNPNNSPNLPEMEEKNVSGYGMARINKGVVSLRNDIGTSYEMYINVQNELAKAFHEVRDEMSIKKWGKAYDELGKERQNIIKYEIVPLAISEAEPKRIGKRGRR